MDYKELLKKFVQAACDAEGVKPEYFMLRAFHEDDFSKEELEELARLENDRGW
ncbi:hypothetical protein NVP1131O_65 [Vibrio phage 1.131.O._10N.222.49.A8]|nr:hypothetical protein NVP1131O_65 [Vibrio phage 1.131.O._10N.222.49.A8]